MEIVVGGIVLHEDKIKHNVEFTLCRILRLTGSSSTPFEAVRKRYKKPLFHRSPLNCGCNHLKPYDLTTLVARSGIDPAP